MSDYLAKLQQRRAKRIEELKNAILQCNDKMQELESLKNTRERLAGCIAELNEQINEIEQPPKGEQSANLHIIKDEQKKEEEETHDGSKTTD